MGDNLYVFSSPLASFGYGNLNHMDNRMDNVLLIPGLGGNGPEHWQSHWEKNREDNRPNCRRVPGVNWNTPEKTTWLNALDDAITSCETPPILIAHSLGCMLAVHWALRMRCIGRCV